MRKSISFYIFTMLESISYVREFIKNVERDEFLQDVLVQDAVLRRLTIIGEVVKSVPDVVRSRYPGVPWRKIAGTRDRVVHDYNHVDLELVWQIISDDLLPFEDRLRAILAELDEEEGLSDP